MPRERAIRCSSSLNMREDTAMSQVSSEQGCDARGRTQAFQFDGAARDSVLGRRQPTSAPVLRQTCRSLGSRVLLPHGRPTRPSSRFQRQSTSCAFSWRCLFFELKTNRQTFQEKRRACQSCGDGSDEKPRKRLERFEVEFEPDEPLAAHAELARGAGKGGGVGGPGVEVAFFEDDKSLAVRVPWRRGVLRASAGLRRGGWNRAPGFRR